MWKLCVWLLAVVALASLEAKPFLLVVYNVENLFDVDGVAGFEEYAPERYTPAHALTKLQNIARIVAQFEQGRGPDVLVLNEIEVDQTPAPRPHNYDAILARYAGMKLDQMLGAKFDREIADLPAEALLVKALADRGMTGYRVIVAENRASDGTARDLQQRNVVLTRFPVKHAQSHPTLDARAILEVQLEVGDALLYVFANHWKSGASDPGLEATRVENARTLRQRVDEILRADRNADIILAGDFNSQYNQRQRFPAMKTTALNDVLGSQGNELAIRGQRDWYNLWYELPPEERGSDTYRGEWGTLMHLIVSRGLYDFRGVQYVDNSFAVAKFPGLNVDALGLPVRWSPEGPTGAGFSDHFPIVAQFTTVPDNRPDRYLPLTRPSAERAGPASARKIDYAKLDLAKIALTAEQFPAGTSLRSAANRGRIVRVEGRVAPGSRLAVEFLGEVYDVWSHDEAFREKLRGHYEAGATIRFYGELGQFRGRWQFVIHDPSWVR